MSEISMQRRNGPRTEVLIEAELFARGKIRAVVLADASLNGVLVEAPDGLDLHHGEVVLVRVSGLPSAAAYVRWIRGGCIGLEFRQPLHPSVIDFALPDYSKAQPLSRAFAASRAA